MLCNGLEEGSGVDETVNILYRQVSIVESLLLYSNN